MSGGVTTPETAKVAKATTEVKLDATRTYVSAALSLFVVGGAVASMIMGLDQNEILVGWGGTVIGFWLGGRSATNGSRAQF